MRNTAGRMARYCKYIGIVEEQLCNCFRDCIYTECEDQRHCGPIRQTKHFPFRSSAPFPQRPINMTWKSASAYRSEACMARWTSYPSPQKLTLPASRASAYFPGNLFIQSIHLTNITTIGLGTYYRVHGKQLRNGRPPQNLEANM